MARTVYKYKVKVGEDLRLWLSTPYRIVHVGQMPTDGDENDTVTVWIEHDPRATPSAFLDFQIIGTGHAVSDFYEHVGSVITPIGLVWHLYLRESPGAALRD